jgi:hypothetical protein
MTKHMSGDREVERDLRKMKTAPEAGAFAARPAVCTTRN